MQKVFFPLLLGAGTALFAIWKYNAPQRAAALIAPRVHETHPTDYFGSPVAGAIHLTGTCGELRPDHFHAGLDIDGRTGNPVYAAADGYIETIKVLATGYGNMLYVKHPNGYTTCYAHLDRFAADIQAFVKKNQYENERFEAELHPPEGMFPVRKGQQIAYLGNTGSSSGPHLHFEVRSPSGKAVNPLLCGIKVTDNVAPDLRDMKIYFLNERREVLGSKAYPLQKDKTGAIDLEGDTIRIGGGRVGFGIKTYDRTSSFRNDNGVFFVSMFNEGQLAFKWTATEFDFDDSRYLNAHIDYPLRRRYGAWFHRCFVLPGDFLSNYERTSGMGAVELIPGKPVKISIVAGDAAGNTSTLNFWVLRDDSAAEIFTSAPYQFLFPFDAENRIDLNGFSMVAQKGTFYETVQMQYISDTTSIAGRFSPTHHLHNTSTPVHKSFDIRIKPVNLPAPLRPKAIIANCNDGKPDNCGGVWQEDWLATRVRSFGDYCVMADTVPPSITPVGFSTDMRRKTAISFRISDNFAVSGTADNLRYRGTIDGKWVLFVYDKKRARLTYTFDEHVGKGEHVVRLSVKDDRQNERVYEAKFIR